MKTMQHLTNGKTTIELTIGVSSTDRTIFAVNVSRGRGWGRPRYYMKYESAVKRVQELAAIHGVA